MVVRLATDSFHVINLLMVAECFECPVEGVVTIRLRSGHAFKVSQAAAAPAIRGLALLAQETVRRMEEAEETG